MIIIEIAGHVGTEPETRVTPDGQKVTTFSVATNIRKKGGDETIWWRVTVWGDRFDKMLTYLKKGSAVIVHGSLGGKPNIYTDKNGNQQVSLDIRADMINFSPFGMPDRDKAQQNQGHQEAAPSYNNGNQTGYQNQNQGRTPYSSNQQVASGQSMQQHHAAPEDDLPF